MCGIIGIVAHEPVNQDIYDGLTVLQHRGQDAAGIITCEGERLHLRKNNGLVRDVSRFTSIHRTESRWHITAILPMQTSSNRNCSSKTCARLIPIRIPRFY
jgi:glutamine phosphoribosylpyrophosphate amidotransferase